MKFISILLIASALADLAAFNRYRNSAGTHVLQRRAENLKQGLSTQDQQVITVMMRLLKKGPNKAAMDKFDQIVKKVKTQKPYNNRLRHYLSY